MARLPFIGVFGLRCFPRGRGSVAVQSRLSRLGRGASSRALDAWPSSGCFLLVFVVESSGFLRSWGDCTLLMGRLRRTIRFAQCVRLGATILMGICQDGWYSVTI